MRRILEIHAAEGGADSQLLVQDLAAIYTKLFGRFG
jgi:protein subunit release factor A